MEAILPILSRLIPDDTDFYENGLIEFEELVNILKRTIANEEDGDWVRDHKKLIVKVVNIMCKAELIVDQTRRDLFHELQRRLREDNEQQRKKTGKTKTRKKKTSLTNKDWLKTYSAPQPRLEQRKSTKTRKKVLPKVTCTSSLGNKMKKTKPHLVEYVPPVNRKNLVQRKKHVSNKSTATTTILPNINDAEKLQYNDKTKRHSFLPAQRNAIK